MSATSLSRSWLWVKGEAVAAFSDVGDRKRDDFKVGLDLGGGDWVVEVCVCCAAADLTDVGNVVVSVGFWSCGSENTLTREYTGTVIVLEDTVVVVVEAAWDLSDE